MVTVIGSHLATRRVHSPNEDNPSATIAVLVQSYSRAWIGTSRVSKSLTFVYYCSINLSRCICRGRHVQPAVRETSRLGLSGYMR